jgi:TATA-box binding protein (TBP) (component of TFIID and TFIIIB)
MIFVTGCGKPTIEEVATNIEIAKNYEATVNLKIDGQFEDEIIDYTREKFITVDNINSSVKVKAIVNLNDYILLGPINYSDYLSKLSSRSVQGTSVGIKIYKSGTTPIE